MGQYKVPQDVEAEDKIIGFLTLKQFIYAVIGIAYGLITFQIFRSILIIWVIIGLPPAGIFLMLGLYQRDGQPFEAYFLALIYYWFKPRHRIWLKEDIVEVFKIEEPKITAEEVRRDPREVRGQLDRLAQIVDTRGWSTKQPEVQEPDMVHVIDLDDRLPTNEMSAPRSEASEIGLDEDILDMNNNPSARNLNVLIQDSVKSVHEEAMEKMRRELPQPPAPVPGQTTQPTSSSVQTTSPLANLESRLATGSNMPRAEAPLLRTTEPAAPASQNINTSEMTVNPIADILKRAMDNTDLKVSQVSQIAAQAQAQAQANTNTLVEGQPLELRPDQEQKS